MKRVDEQGSLANTTPFLFTHGNQRMGADQPAEPKSLSDALGCQVVRLSDCQKGQD
jgi:hypothetical protein